MLLELHHTGLLFGLGCHTKVPNFDHAIIIASCYYCIVLDVHYGIDRTGMSPDKATLQVTV